MKKIILLIGFLSFALGQNADPKTCKNMQFFNETTGECICPEDAECPDGMNFNKWNCACKCAYKRCPSGFSHNKTTCQCELKSTKCAEAFKTCPEGLFDGQNCACFPQCPKEEKCFGKQKWQNDTCMCSCPYDFRGDNISERCGKNGTDNYWNEDQCECVANLDCIQKAKECPAGRWDHLNCKCHEACAAENLPTKIPKENLTLAREWQYDYEVPRCETGLTRFMQRSFYGQVFNTPSYDHFSCGCQCRFPEDEEVCTGDRYQWNQTECICQYIPLPLKNCTEITECPDSKYWENETCSCKCHNFKQRFYAKSPQHSQGGYGSYGGGYGSYGGGYGSYGGGIRSQLLEFRENRTIFDEETCSYVPSTQCNETKAACQAQNGEFNRFTCECNEGCPEQKNCTSPHNSFNNKTCQCECGYKRNCGDKKSYDWDPDTCMCKLNSTCAAKKANCNTLNFDDTTCECLPNCTSNLTNGTTPFKGRNIKRSKFWNRRTCQLECKRTINPWNVHNKVFNESSCQWEPNDRCNALKKSCVPKESWSEKECRCLGPCPTSCDHFKKKQNKKSCSCSCKWENKPDNAAYRSSWDYYRCEYKCYPDDKKKCDRKSATHQFTEFPVCECQLSTLIDVTRPGMTTKALMKRLRKKTKKHKKRKNKKRKNKKRKNKKTKSKKNKEKLTSDDEETTMEKVKSQTETARKTVTDWWDNFWE